jgi:hypothetical protein
MLPFQYMSISTALDEEDRDCDVVLGDSVMWAEGWEKGWKGARVNGGAVVTRQGTRVDGNSSSQARNWPSK